ncbi:MAG: hypothetical protein VB138_11030 [Burkholderia sp.]
MIPGDAKYAPYRERLFAAAEEIQKIHGGLLAITPHSSDDPETQERPCA